MFRVYTAAFLLSFLSVVTVKCSIDLKESVEELTAQIKHLAHKGCLSSDAFKLKRHFLRDRNTTCNDGTPAGYYLKKAHGSKRWIVYLDGGEFCNSGASCGKRYSDMRQLMSSSFWNETRIGSGILSTDPRENPSWWNANQVYVPYCSSDAWSGNASKWETGERFSFLGTRILEKVIEELMRKGLAEAKRLLLSGSSAGGIGVILNLDRLVRRIKMAGLKVEVRGLADSGWYLDMPIPETNQIQQGMAYWRGVVPEDCARRNPTRKWKCYFAENVYRTDSKSPKHSPLFVFQWLYDQAQIAWVVSGTFRMPDDAHKQRQIHNIALQLGFELRKSLNRTKDIACSVFVPSCIAHTILTRDDWLKVMVGGKNLNDAIDEWYQSSGKSLASCRPLIERCPAHAWRFQNCARTCPALDKSLLPRPRSTGSKPDSALPSRSNQ